MKVDREIARIMESMRWVWKPTNCELIPFDHLRLVKWLQDHEARIVFLGDSISEDMSNAMKGMLQPNGSGLVVNARFDGLGVSGIGSAEGDVRLSWNRVATQFNIKSQDIVVINTGAHWKNGTVTLEKINNISMAIKDEIEAQTIVWRHSIKGHRDCERFHRPFAKEEMTPELRENLSSLYNWANFGESNDLFVKSLTDVLDDRTFLVLDVSMFERRPDGHAVPGYDCLHYCTPSAINEWNKILFHVLMKQGN